MLLIANSSIVCKDISQLNLQTMKMVGWLEHLTEMSEDKFQLKLKEENITIFSSIVLLLYYNKIYNKTWKNEGAHPPSATELATSEK